ncbi:methyltransferase domain-containing protein [Glaciecola sp. MH2013]|uniref:methyltransferase domain-containing protein n=1 Tax=Glaciecola sp. MH2013 TaxID=2785524 RepID=UPI00189D6EEB|nr:methyltransferase domain-containing protein [Glaciecola sp. MH2013]MBF7073174.1 methyltransferase domain-containing protein [Glaciecola sp. MH2013]
MNAVQQIAAATHDSTIRKKARQRMVDDNKQLIANNFAKAANQYNAHARVQKRVAQALFDELDQQLILGRGSQGNVNQPQFPKAMDLGCATGINTATLASYAETTIGLDISLGMLDIASAQVERFNHNRLVSRSLHWLAADAEHLPLASQSIDLVYSSMAMQWCESPSAAIAEIRRVLAPKGKAFLAIMLGSSMMELHKAYHALGIPSRVNSFHLEQDWLNAAAACTHHTKTFVDYHPDALAMLKSLKSVGAATKQSPNNESMCQASITRRELKGLEQEMSQHAQGYPLSYDLLFLSIGASAT